MSTLDARSQIRPKATSPHESRPAPSHIQRPCPQRRRNDHQPKRTISPRIPARSPISPPARGKCGRRDTPTPLKDACPAPCRPFGAGQPQARPWRQNRGELGALRNVRPPGSPRSSWRPTAFDVPAPRRMKRHQTPRLPAMIPPAGRWRRPQVPAGEQQCNGRKINEHGFECGRPHLRRGQHRAWRRTRSRGRTRPTATQSSRRGLSI